MVETVFEKLNVPCSFIIKSGVLSAFSCGKSTCLVLDSAHNHTSAIPILDGYILNKSLQKVEYGGHTINQSIKDLLNTKGIDLKPLYTLKREKDAHGNITSV